MSEEEFLVVAPIGRDAELIASRLGRVGICALPLPDIAHAVAHAHVGAAGLITTDEALPQPALEHLESFIRDQPAWSDFPIIVLTSGMSEHTYTGAGKHLRERLGNVTLLDRPLRVDSFVSAVETALRSRQRQYQARDSIAQRLELEESLRKAERMAIAGTMAASIAHEINNPLAAITNLLYLISHSKNPNDVRRYSDVAMAELLRVAEIVKQTLRFHRANVQPTEVDLEEIVDSTLQLFRARLMKQNISVRRELAVRFAHCSSAEVRQCLVNIIGNAIDAMPNGGVLTVRTNPFTNSMNRPFVRIVVADTGFGIPEDAKASIFDRFFSTKGTNGSGLGLWLARDIIGRNGGSIRFRSRIQKPSGTVFGIHLPCETASEKMKQAA